MRNTLSSASRKPKMAFHDDNDGIQSIFWKFRTAFNIGLKGHLLSKKDPKISQSSSPIDFQSALH